MGKKRKRDRDDDASSADEEEMTPDQNKAKRKKDRKHCAEKAACAWAQEDTAMLPFMDLPYANMDLSNPSTAKQAAMTAGVDALWTEMEVMGILVPRNNKATWTNIPHRGKVAGYMEVRRLGIPWNVFEYNEKAMARLGKLRSRGDYFVS